MLNPAVRLVCIGHSKGVVDATAAVAMFPHFAQHVDGMVSMQAPYAGATVVHDLTKTQVQQKIASTLMKRLVGGSFEAVTDLTYSNRQKFLASHPFPAHKIPVISLASCVHSQVGKLNSLSLLLPMIDYVKLRYNACSDGCVTQQDAVIPRSIVVCLNDQDHFGPAFSALPATDQYAPSRLIASLLVVLHEQHPMLENKAAKIAAAKAQGDRTEESDSSQT